MVDFRYQRPIRPPRRVYRRAVILVAGYALVSVLVVLTHLSALTTPDFDPAYGGDRSADGRPTLQVGRDVRYRIHVREGAASPRDCVLVTKTGAVHPLSLDRSDGSPVEEDGVRYRWVGSFRSPVDAWAAVQCTPDARAPLRVEADPSELLPIGLAFFAAPLVLLLAAVMTLVTWVRRRRGKRLAFVRPATPELDAEIAKRVAMADRLVGGTAQTFVLFRHGTLVPAGTRTGHDAVVHATELLRRSADPGDGWRVAAVDDGWTVACPESGLRVLVGDDETRRPDTQEIGRIGRAKLRMDARRPMVLHLADGRTQTPAAVAR
ncbi:hypothetical protein Arub01_40040 [Actinomadura rubrobrunea]|uniref:Uncharacterized protein n=1 Tax=Actinomadura rubrobrunea TaxID=115335 RepID=A0A9W6PXD7_9ACTN|nr:hypothetical protein [Actinomadura rubrobrunea]GLW65760.1 hypothetical protein Arub01_40040 [Actinomadura rubrobrunea]